MLATALVLGGNIRTGSNHLYLPNGEMAKSNAEMVAVAEQLCRSTGRNPRQSSRRARSSRSGQPGKG
jgi:uncharacterized protein (DUF849 family)